MTTQLFGVTVLSLLKAQERYKNVDEVHVNILFVITQINTVIKISYSF